VLARLDPESSWERFLVALRSDAEDIQGGTTQEGIHMGVMSGTIDLMERAYCGAEIRDGVLHFEPRLPSAVDEVAFRMQFRRTPLQVSVDHDRLTIKVDREGGGGAIQVGVGDESRELCPGDVAAFELERSSAVTADMSGSDP
jgi:trehalose/maltose hydrolase-like predicted phosphorylase